MPLPDPNTVVAQVGTATAQVNATLDHAGATLDHAVDSATNAGSLATAALQGPLASMVSGADVVLRRVFDAAKAYGPQALDGLFATVRAWDLIEIVAGLICLALSGLCAWRAVTSFRLSKAAESNSPAEIESAFRFMHAGFLAICTALLMLSNLSVWSVAGAILPQAHVAHLLMEKATAAPPPSNSK